MSRSGPAAASRSMSNSVRMPPRRRIKPSARMSVPFRDALARFRARRRRTGSATTVDVLASFSIATNLRNLRDRSRPQSLQTKTVSISRSRNNPDWRQEPSRQIFWNLVQLCISLMRGRQLGSGHRPQRQVFSTTRSTAMPGQAGRDPVATGSINGPMGGVRQAASRGARICAALCDSRAAVVRSSLTTRAIWSPSRRSSGGALRPSWCIQ